MLKKVVSGLLSFFMIAMLMPAPLFAASSGTTASGKLIISDKTYEIAPDIIEREYITNNASLSAQQRGHVMEVKPGKNAQIIAGYNDYNIDAIKSGNNWGMRKTTEQAQAVETRTGVNVVGAVNGDFFDMSNGRPTGALVMNGTVIQKSNRPCFYIDGDGMPHITADSSTMPDGVKEAVSGWQILVDNGRALTFNDTTTNPRTAVGIKADNTVVFYMVDGRQAPLSIGMTSDELAQTMADLGCVTAINLDGGGSSTFATQRAGDENDNKAAGLTLRCSPSDGYERTVSSSLLVVSAARATGVFDHAVLSPNQEVYTPGSIVKFNAQGADSAGGSAALPESGLSWTVTEGADIASIDAVTGTLTAAEGKTGAVTVALNYNGKVVGTTSVELQWPDKVGFTNANISLDFGERSTLTFVAYWKNMPVNYKDGDIKWTMSDNSMGRFEGNTFIATETASQKGVISASPCNDDSVSATVDIVIGLEPYVLMDFEDHLNPDGTVIKAKDYWTIHVGASDVNGGQGMLAPAEVDKYRLWLRYLGQAGTEHNASLVNLDDGQPVRFGENSLRMDFDFNKNNVAAVSDSVFGFAADTLLDIVQPTKIGMWIYVPEECKFENYQLKAVIKGKGYKTNDDTSYRTYDQNNNETISSGGLNGTTAYVNYFSYDENGNVTGSDFADWAGKGWVWVECDVSHVQMPLDLCRAYTVRIIAAQNVANHAGHIYIDNLQLIYGTNTNDTVKPKIDSIQGQCGSGAKIDIKDGETIFTGSTLNFVAEVSDPAGKYATGIDPSTARLYIDGINLTNDERVEFIEGSNTFYLTGMNLTNGQHSIRISVRDRYGNETTETRYFIVADDNGKGADISLTAEKKNPAIGEKYTLELHAEENASIIAANLTLSVPSAYANSYKVIPSNGYKITTSGAMGSIEIKAIKTSESAGSVIAKIQFDIPAEGKQGDTFTYAVSGGSYTNDQNQTFSFSEREKSVPLTAAATVSAGQSVVGFETELTVLDNEGKPVANAQVFSGNQTLGETDQNGHLTYTYTKGGRVTVYALTSTGRSWNKEFVVSSHGLDGNGAPFGIQNNASADGASMKQITWMSAINQSDSRAFIKYAISEDEVSSAIPIEGKSEIFDFVDVNEGTAFRLNSVNLKNLNPQTQYYYQVGDGRQWSDIMTFKTATDEKAGSTNFFVFGDIQSDDTANAAAAIHKIKDDVKDYAFGIQTGDAIDSVTKFSNWRSFLTTLNAGALGGIDMIHVLGNHEYYGDAAGKISGSVFGLPVSSAGSYYSAEYGSVYAAVINNGGSVIDALKGIKEEAKKSSCAWKVLAIHEPIYGTAEEMDAERRDAITRLIEEAGIDFVFTGDDHAYARTYPMLGDEVQDEKGREGVVYYVSGDLSSKSNDFHNRDYYASAIPHVEYQGMYITAEATNEKITITARKYDGTILDTYTEYRTDCEVGNHTFDETSLYDVEHKTLTCTLCGKAAPAKDSGYTGRLKTVGRKGEVVLAAGAVKNGWFTLGEEILHAGTDGLLHKTQTHDSATCKEDGHIIADCECGASYTGAYTYSKGHTWDENHVCTVCGTEGISMDDVTLSLNGKYWEYTGSNIRASANAMYGDYKLIATSDRNGKDAYKSYSNNKKVGMGTVTFEGRGDFYGSKSIDFPIVPKSVTTISASQIFSTSAFIKWDAAAGAGYYRVYQKTSSGWKKVGVTKDTSINIRGLKPETEYVFKVASSTDVDGATFNCLYWSNELTVNTKAKSTKQTEEFLSSLKGICQVNGNAVELPMTVVKGAYYLMLPSNADLTALQLNLAMNDETQAVTFMGSEGIQQAKGNTVTIDVLALSGNTKAASHEIMIALPDCEPMMLQIMKSENIPAVYLTSDDLENQGRDFVDASKSNVTTAKMAMVSANGDTIYNGALTQLKARGNSTFTYYDKKSYQIKLGDKSDLLGTGERVKTWVLLAGYGDATQMHDKLIKDLAAKMGMPYVASCDWVDLYYDGEYRGIYLLSEKNSVNKTSVNITDMEDAYGTENEDYGDNPKTSEGVNAYDQKYQYTEGLNEPGNITGGYLIERNLDTIDEASGFYTRQGGGFNVKSPEYAGNEAMKYISEYYQEFEDAVYAKDEDGNYTGYNEKTGKYYYDYCDVDSLVKVFLLQDLALNPDGFLSSCYFYKDADGKLYAGPVWDQEMAFGTGFTIRISPDITNYHYLAEALIHIPDFREAVESYYDGTFKDLVKELIGDDGVIAEYQKKIQAGTAKNYVMWPYVKIGSPNVSGHYWTDGTTYADIIKDMQQWTGKRLNKLDTLYGDGTLHTQHTYTSQVTKEPTYTEEGVRTYTCTVCGDTYTETIPKLTPPSGGGTTDLPDPDVPKDDKPSNLEDFRKEAIEELNTIAEKNSYESKEQSALEQILKDAEKKIESAETEEEVETIVTAVKKKINTLDTAEDKKLIRSIQKIDSDTFRAKSKLSKLNGKTAVKVSWNKPGNINFDGYEVFRSTKKSSGFGKKPYFTAKNRNYKNNKGLVKGKTYYYKVRAYKIVNGKKVYTKWSTKAFRTIK